MLFDTFFFWWGQGNGSLYRQNRNIVVVRMDRGSTESWRYLGTLYRSSFFLFRKLRCNIIFLWESKWWNQSKESSDKWRFVYWQWQLGNFLPDVSAISIKLASSSGWIWVGSPLNAREIAGVLLLTVHRYSQQDLSWPPVLSPLKRTDSRDAMTIVLGRAWTNM